MMLKKENPVSTDLLFEFPTISKINVKTCIYQYHNTENF